MHTASIRVGIGLVVLPFHFTLACATRRRATNTHGSSQCHSLEHAAPHQQVHVRMHMVYALCASSWIHFARCTSAASAAKRSRPTINTLQYYISKPYHTHGQVGTTHARTNVRTDSRHNVSATTTSAHTHILSCTRTSARKTQTFRDKT